MKNTWKSDVRKEASKSDLSNGKETTWDERSNKGIRTELSFCIYWSPSFNTTPRTAFSNLCSFYLRITSLLLVPLGALLPISYSRLFWSTQSCNHWPCPSTILVFYVFTWFPLRSSAKGLSRISKSSFFFFSHFLYLSTYPSVLSLPARSLCFLQWEKSHTNHSVSSLSPILHLISLSHHNFSHSLFAWSTLGESNALIIASQRHSLSPPAAVITFTITRYSVMLNTQYECVSVCVRLGNCKTDLTAGKMFLATSEFPIR